MSVDETGDHHGKDERLSEFATSSNNAADHMPRRSNSAAITSKVVPFVQRPTCTIKEACGAVGLGRTKRYELIGGGALETLTIGRRRLVRVPSLLKFLGMGQP